MLQPVTQPHPTKNPSAAWPPSPISHRCSVMQWPPENFRQGPGWKKDRSILRKKNGQVRMASRYQSSVCHQRKNCLPEKKRKESRNEFYTQKCLLWSIFWLLKQQKMAMAHGWYWCWNLMESCQLPWLHAEFCSRSKGNPLVDKDSTVERNVQAISIDTSACNLLDIWNKLGSAFSCASSTTP